MFTCAQDALNELFAANLAVVIAVLSTEKVGYARSIVLVPVHVATTPFVEIKVLESFHLFI